MRYNKRERIHARLELKKAMRDRLGMNGRDPLDILIELESRGLLWLKEID